MYAPTCEQLVRGGGTRVCILLCISIFLLPFLALFGRQDRFFVLKKIKMRGVGCGLTGWVAGWHCHVTSHHVMIMILGVVFHIYIFFAVYCRFFLFFSGSFVHSFPSVPHSTAHMNEQASMYYIASFNFVHSVLPHRTQNGAASK